MRVPAMSVCLLQQDYSKTRALISMTFACGQVSGHGRTDQLLSPIRIIVRMPEPDCFLPQRVHCIAEFYYVRKMPHTGIGRPSKQRRVVLRRRNTVVGGRCALPSALLVVKERRLSWIGHILRMVDSKLPCHDKFYKLTGSQTLRSESEED